MEKLSKEAEGKLIAALDKMAAAIETGCSPTAAVVKVARELQIPAGHIQLLTNAYNIGSTNRQRQLGDTVWDKAASFELADPQAALAELYPTRAKTAAQYARETSVSPEYRSSPRSLLEERRQPRVAEKHACVQMRGSSRPKISTNPETLSKRAVSDLKRQEQELDGARSELGHIFEKLAAALTSFTNHFKLADAIPFGDAACTLKLLYGSAGEKLCQAALELSPGLGKSAKHAATGRPVRTDVAPFNHVADFFSHQDLYLEKNAVFQRLSAKFAADKQALLRLPEAPKPFNILDGLAPRPPGFNVLDLLDGRKEAAGFGGAFQGALTGSVAKDLTNQTLGALQPASPNKLIQRYLDRLQDPSHEGELHKIRTQSTIHDLLANDPVIAGHNPHAVLEAINDLISVAPRIADQAPILQAATRRHLQQGQLDPFEIGQLLDVDRKLRSRDTGKNELSEVLGDAR